MNSQLFYGSICISDLAEKAKQGHSAFTKGQNGKVYANIAVWQNDEADQYGNSMAIQLQSTKEKKETEGKVYLGNCKKSEPKQLSQNEAKGIGEQFDDLPF